MTTDIPINHEDLAEQEVGESEAELLPQIDSPEDLRHLDAKDLPRLATELRQFLIESVSRTGGHLSAGLGTVELTIALHYIFGGSSGVGCWPSNLPTQDSYRPT